MIFHDKDALAIIERLDSIVVDGRVYLAVDSLKLVNDSLAESIINAAEHLTQDEFWSMASVVEMYTGVIDTLTANNAAEMVPDDLSGFDA